MNKSYVVACVSLLWLACGDSEPERHVEANESVDASTPPAAGKPSKPAADGGSAQPATAGKSAGAAGAKHEDEKPQDTEHTPPAAGSGGSVATAQDAGQAQHDEDAGPPPACGTTVAKIDLLFVVDNSSSMAGAQAALRAQFPRMIQFLSGGGSSPLDGSRRPAAPDLHIGVVSTDMGIPGVDSGSCHSDGGDDGRLQHQPRAVAGTTCESSYPAFLSYDSAAKTDAAKLASDLSCIAALGTGGCGFEQQLEAPLKALWPAKYLDEKGNPVSPNPITFLAKTAAGKLGRGDAPAADGGNLGFLRPDSMVAIVLLTDEEDCSVRSTDHLRPSDQLPDTSPYKSELDTSLRCFNHPEFYQDVISRYYKGLLALRPGHEALVVFSAIVGVPSDLVDVSSLRATDFSQSSARDAFYDKILNDARMQQKVDPSTNPGSGNGNLVPSCSRTAGGEKTNAYPPRRIVQLAKAFGENSLVQSICQDDLAPAVDAIADRIAQRLENECTKR